MSGNKQQISYDTYFSVSTQAHEIVTSPQPGDAGYPMPSNPGDLFYSEFMCDKSAFGQFALVARGAKDTPQHILEYVNHVAERLSDLGVTFINTAEACAIRCVAKNIMKQGGVRLPSYGTEPQ